MLMLACAYGGDADVAIDRDTAERLERASRPWVYNETGKEESKRSTTLSLKDKIAVLDVIQKSN